MKSLVCFALLMLLAYAASAQPAVLSGTVRDAADGMELIGVAIVAKGTRYGAVTDENGFYRLELPAGTYQLEASYIGYEKMLYTGIALKAGESRTLNISMKVTAVTLDEEVVIIGDRPLIDVEDSRSRNQLNRDVIEAVPVRNVQGLLNTQTGVVLNPEGLHIRGGRTYQTGFFIDDVSASDPLAGTGFGIELGSNAIDQLEVSTSAPTAEYGDAASGIVNTRTRSGGDRFALDASVKQDHFGFNSQWASVFNQTTVDGSAGGPVWLKGSKRLRYFTSIRLHFTDTYIKNPADQLVSSLYPDTRWAPRQDNRWTGMVKLNYDFSPVQRLNATYLKSLTINQDFNMLRITGADVPYTPGYQWAFHLQPDHANTYTHDTNLESLQWNHTPRPSFNYRISVSRLFVRLRADANGRPWRPAEVTTEFDPASIVEFPVSYFPAGDSVVFVLSPPGLYNNDGIATLWHDHWVKEYAVKGSSTFYSANTRNRLMVGAEVKPQHMQWIDIYRPWIGAPIPLPDSQFTQSFRLGDVSDIWAVQPLKGAFFLTNKYRYLGLVADVGLRLEYWMPGQYVDDAVANPDALIAEEFRQTYLRQTVRLFGRRTKLRLLPKLAASFPIRENQVMYFNYGVSTVYPHPSYVYAGLNPFYADRSTLGFIGNPALNPEVDISYELGLKSQIGSHDALTVAAFWKDQYDFITSSAVLLRDATGRDVIRTLRINSDYARIRGLEAAYIKRAGSWLEASLSFSYSVATGQSSSASQTLQEILATGNSETARETPLAWDSPWDVKGYALFTLNRREGLFNVRILNHATFYVEAIFRSGRRYTPYLFRGYEPFSGRPIYEINSQPEARYSALGAPGFWLNLNLRKWFELRGQQLAVTCELTNALNNKNTAIVNPVTGRAYEYGDDVPTEWRDPRYNDPRDPRSANLPPDNPARYFEGRHLLLGLALRIQ
ncbi:MAG: carboxypeptidase-like regulatory domain-containing protein [Chitinophagales bacterium]|nr:carboxypeptidase-like regulatory domain-containing protein [Chitinophagales bacterium]MDW8394387.1 carboxypeptidase-like regulatory domain-containing protein [Chitinophagales bacterium]